MASYNMINNKDRKRQGKNCFKMFYSVTDIFRAAEHYHRYKNEERMLDSLNRINSVQDRVRFLLSQPIGKLYLSHRQTAKAQASIHAVLPELLLFAQAYLFFRAAEHYHRYKNEERMLDSLSRIESVQDRVRFLLEKNYMRYAAKILEENGKLLFFIFVLLLQMKESFCKFHSRSHYYVKTRDVSTSSLTHLYY